MDIKQLAQDIQDDFNDRSFREKAREVVDPNIVVTDTPTGQQMNGIDGFVQYSESYVTTIFNKIGADNRAAAAAFAVRQHLV